MVLSHPTEFRSPAYRALMRALGESDATVEWIEVGVREIAHVSTTKGAGVAKELAVQHGVHVHPIDLTKLRSRSARLQILAVYQQAESFFQAFRHTHPRQVEYNPRQDEDVLSATLRAFTIATLEVGQLEVGLFHYYRDARNLFMHNPQGNQSKEKRTNCINLREQVATSSYSNLNAPNYTDQIQFDDFVLFTRILKQLAANLCTATNPTDDELAACVRQDKQIMRKLNSLKDNRRRSINVVASFLRERYSIPIERAESISHLVLNEAR